jgi:hypothetical protein
MTWFTLERMHPLDRFGSAIDTVILAALGFPFWAQVGNVFVRHFYGYFIHADVPWTLGKASWLINSPAMHRWHHARDVKGSGSNFSTSLAPATCRWGCARTWGRARSASTCIRSGPGGRRSSPAARGRSCPPNRLA